MLVQSLLLYIYNDPTITLYYGHPVITASFFWPLGVRINGVPLYHHHHHQYRIIIVIIITVNSLLTDTSVRRTLGVGPYAPFFIHVTVSKLSISWTPL